MRGMVDIFCQIIDNHGDLGVCLRLARQWAARGGSTRLWVDDASALKWMGPDVAQGAVPGLQVMPWADASQSKVLAGLQPATVWIEAFGCEIPADFVAHGVKQTAMQQRKPPIWINLEYLSAEPFVERFHGLPSPITTGPAQGWIKHFFYPGFTARTGGLLREIDLLQDLGRFDREAHRRTLGSGVSAQTPLISLF